MKTKVIKKSVPQRKPNKVMTPKELINKALTGTHLEQPKPTLKEALEQTSAILANRDKFSID